MEAGKRRGTYTDAQFIPAVWVERIVGKMRAPGDYFFCMQDFGMKMYPGGRGTQ